MIYLWYIYSQQVRWGSTLVDPTCSWINPSLHTELSTNLAKDWGGHLGFTRTQGANVSQWLFQRRCEGTSLCFGRKMWRGPKILGSQRPCSWWFGGFQKCWYPWIYGTRGCFLMVGYWGTTIYGTPTCIHIPFIIINLIIYYMYVWISLEYTSSYDIWVCPRTGLPSKWLFEWETHKINFW